MTDRRRHAGEQAQDPLSVLDEIERARLRRLVGGSASRSGDLSAAAGECIRTARRIVVLALVAAAVCVLAGMVFARVEVVLFGMVLLLAAATAGGWWLVLARARRKSADA